jgi:TRAP-type C4-dicarboxylate transport system permease small subunit
MAESEEAPPPPKRAAGIPWIHKLDDGIYALERFLVVSATAAMVLIVFFDVLDRRAKSPDNKLATLLHAVTRSGAPAIDAWVAPILGALLTAALLWFAFATLRERGTLKLAPALEPLVAIGGTGLLYGLVLLMRHRPSNEFYAVTWALSCTAWLVGARRAGAKGSQLAALVSLPIGALVLWKIIPEGYAWAKEVAMMLLVWTGLLGASMAMHDGQHIEVEFGRKLFPKKLRPWVAIIAHVVTAGFCIVLVLLAYVYLFGEMGLKKLDMRLPDTQLPAWLVPLPVLLAFAMMAVRLVITALRVLAGDDKAKGSSPDAAPEDLTGGHTIEIEPEAQP